MLLDGIKVVEFSKVIAAPMASLILADLGADIIKIELPAGDDSRYLGPIINGESILYHAVNRNKKGIVLDMNQQPDRESFERFIRTADVFIHNFRPGAEKKMGINYEKLKEINPKLIYCSVTAFGETGPYANKPGLDIIFQSMSGLMSVTGEPEGKPIRAGTPLVDVAGGITAALAITSALYNRERTGEGKKVSISLLDVGIFLQAPMFTKYFATKTLPERLGNASAFAFALDFRTKDERIAISIPNDKFWRKLCSALEQEQLQSDEKFTTNAKRLENKGMLEEKLTDVFLGKSADEWIDLLSREGIPVSKIYTYKDVINDPQIQHNHLFAEFSSLEIGNISSPVTPIFVDGQYNRKISPPPRLNEHKEKLLKQIEIINPSG